MEQELLRLIEDNKEKYYRVAFSYVKNRENALDIVHEAIVKALQKIDSLHHRQYLETWFYRILINESISFARKNKKIIYLDELSETPVAVVEDADRERYTTLYEAIDHLSPKFKTVVIRRYFEDMKFEQIAQITSTKLSTVKARLYKALKLLKIDREEIEDD